MNRRDFIGQSGILGASMFAPFIRNIVSASLKNDPVILIVSGWQDVNIGDIAHTPGLLHLLNTYMPASKLILWKRSAGEEVRNLLNRNFPSVRIIHGNVDADRNTESRDVLDAFSQADIMVHGSGPSLAGASNLACWAKATGKPYGVFGVTLQDPPQDHTEILRKASFIFTRETYSIEHLKKAGIKGSHIAFAPDATFFMNIRDDAKAGKFLSDNLLETRKFICVVPRLRFTPYHLINPNRNGWSDERIRMVEETNKKHGEKDHAKLREAMITWVRETGNKIVVCPEMTYEVSIMDELLIDPLPADIRSKIVKHGYWLPDEAASLYSKAHTLLSFECHSPIIAAAAGTPMIYLRQPEDTIKGQMYYDLGLTDNVFEIENTSGRQISGRLMDFYSGYAKSLKNISRSLSLVKEHYDKAIGIMKERI
jgi:hypothetical protein